MKRILLLVAALAAVAAPGALAARPALNISPSQVRFGSQPFESSTKKSFTVTNRSSRTLSIMIDQVRVPDDFSPGQIESTCPLSFTETLLAPGQSCTHVVGFRPSAFFAGRELAILRVTARDQAGAVVYARDVKMTGRGI